MGNGVNDNINYVTNLNENFLIKLEDGKIKTATPITRLKIQGTDTEYFYYAIDDENDSNKASILASRLVVEENNGQKVETLKDLENEEERKVAFQLFSEAYSMIKEEISEQ